MLRRQHARNDTLVIDELGLNHGKCRADIAVVNGHLVGYEIKSDNDSLRRLGLQVESYNAVFDRAFIVVGNRHIDRIQDRIPEWWGVIESSRGPRGAVNFSMMRKAQMNRNVDPISLARLLWRDEAAEEVAAPSASPTPRSIVQTYGRTAKYLRTAKNRQAVSAEA